MTRWDISPYGCIWYLVLAFGLMLTVASALIPHGGLIGVPAGICIGLCIIRGARIYKAL